jgi:hypothetical protein
MYSAIRAVLPRGTALDQAMLTPLSPEERSVVAARLPIQAGPAYLLPDPSSGRLSLTAIPAGSSPTSTAVGLETSRGRPPRSASARPTAAIKAIAALMVLGGGGYETYRWVRPHAPAPPGPAAVIVPAPATSSAAPDPTTATPASAPTPVATTAQLAVSPPTASVEVDGTATPVSSGHVALTGLLGSIHHVRVYQGRREVQADVVIASTGAVPPSVDLGLRTAAAPGGPATKNGTAQPPPAVAVPPAPPPAPKPPAGGGVDRDFH